jgi:UDPglucose 6-dehydrogenase
MSASGPQRVAVAGLWHLGAVTAACLASGGIPTIGFDSDAARIARLRQGEPPIFEPGLAELVRQGLAHGTLRFTTDPTELGDADVLWATWDTPVDDHDVADVEGVFQELTALFPHLRDHCLILVSSQVPVGTVRRLEEAYRAARPDGRATFGCIPENLRLGDAIAGFVRPDRVVLGARSAADVARVQALLAPFDVRIDVMRVESAELTKHALNAFLATSIVFANELARLAERVGADAVEVEHALKSDLRIGPRAYLHPGGAYAGGTLARDIGFLIERGETFDCDMPLVRGVRASNDAHRTWMRDALVRLLGGVRGAHIAVLGLTYKPGTDTLRRSAAVELCTQLAAEGARVTAYDPAVASLPAELADIVSLGPSAQASVRACDATVLATAWPEFRSLTAEDFLDGRQTTAVVDPGGFLAAIVGDDPRIHYARVGAIS